MLLLLAGCRQDMQDQPKFIPQRGTSFLCRRPLGAAAGRTHGARGQLREDEYFYTGLVNGKEQDALPFPATIRFSSADRSATTSIARPATRAWAMATA